MSDITNYEIGTDLPLREVRSKVKRIVLRDFSNFVRFAIMDWTVVEKSILPEVYNLFSGYPENEICMIVRLYWAKAKANYNVEIFSEV